MLPIFLPLPLADAGTPLMWASAFHLLIGNAIIGFIEAGLIIHFFKTRPSPTLLLMIAANYCSAWLGTLVLAQVHTPLIYDLPRYIAAAFVLTWLFTIFVEWPFIMPLFRGRPKWLRDSFKASLIVQTASYLLLTLYYTHFSHTGLLTNTHLDRQYTQWANRDAILFYIGSDNHVYRCKFDGSDVKKISNLDLSSHQQHLFAWKTNPDQSWDLYATTADPFVQNGKNLLVLPHFAAVAATYPWVEDGELLNYISRGNAVDLRQANAREWLVHYGFWAAEGMTLTNKTTGRKNHIALETPFGAPQINDTTVLPGDQIVFQLTDQICILDRQTMRLGMITRGRSPVVAFETAPNQ